MATKPKRFDSFREMFCLCGQEASAYHCVKLYTRPDKWCQLLVLSYRFDFVQIPLFHPLFKRDHPLVVPRKGPATRSDMVMTGNDWATLVVAKLSPWIQLESRDPDIRQLSEDVSEGKMHS